MSDATNIVICGSGGTGKTAILMRFIKESFEDKYEPTIESSYTKVFGYDGAEYNLELIDTSGRFVVFFVFCFVLFCFVLFCFVLFVVLFCFFQTMHNHQQPSQIPPQHPFPKNKNKNKNKNKKNSQRRIQPTPRRLSQKSRRFSCCLCCRFSPLFR